MQNNLPQGWIRCKLGEAFNIERGGSPRPIKEYLTSSKDGINWIKIGDTKNTSKYIFETKEKIKPEGIRHSRFVAVGDLILSNSMSFGRPYIMKTSGCIHDGWVVFRNQYKIATEEFLYYMLSSQKIYSEFSRVATGSTVKNLNIDRIKGVNIIIPPLNEQKRIVEKIESEFKKIDEGLEHLLKAKEQIKQYRQSVLKSAFEGKLYKTSEWLNTVLENIIDVNPKTDIPTIDLKDLVSFLPMPSVYAETNKYDEELIQYEKVKKGYTKFQNQDVLFAKITPCMENGKTCVVDNLKFGVGFGSTEFHVLRSLGTIIPKFIFYFVVQKSFRKQAQNVMTGAVGQRRVPADYLKNISINLPTLEEQKKIVEEIEKRFAVADEAEKVVEDSIEKAKQLKQSILKKAFEGRLVSQDPNDEPASKLLEKIKQERNKNDRK